MRAAPMLAIVLLAAVGCAGTASNLQRVLRAASRDLGCPAWVTSGTNEHTRFASGLRARRLPGPYWRATCGSRTARYLCDMQGCRRDEVQPGPGTTDVEVGAFQCTMLGGAPDGGARLARAVAPISDEMLRCGATAFTLHVAPMTGSISLDLVSGDSAPGASACVARMIDGLAADLAPEEQQVYVCRPRH